MCFCPCVSQVSPLHSSCLFERLQAFTSRLFSFFFFTFDYHFVFRTSYTTRRRHEFSPLPLVTPLNLQVFSLLSTIMYICVQCAASHPTMSDIFRAIREIYFYDLGVSTPMKIAIRHTSFRKSSLFLFRRSTFILLPQPFSNSVENVTQPSCSISIQSSNSSSLRSYSTMHSLSLPISWFLLSAFFPEIYIYFCRRYFRLAIP